MNGKDMAARVKARREQIQQDAPCEGCGTTLARCKAERGKDPTAPPWFGCCARGAMLSVPCNHQVSRQAVLDLLREVESGTVRTVEEIQDRALMDSITEYPFDPDRIMKWWRDHPEAAHAALEEATWD